MLRVKQSKNASYYTNEFGEKENYYDKESKGFWMGPAKDYLGLKDELSIDEYNKLFKGQSPDGKNLTFQTGKERTYDCTLNCNKDLSILKSAYPHLAITFDAVTFQAVKDTLEYAQQFIAVRETKNGVTTKNFDTNSIFGVFHHSTSRELDPHDHFHCLLMPVSFNEKGKAYANDVKELYKHQKEIGLFFQKSIANGLERELGLKTAFNEKGLSRILGITKEERDYFSKRRDQIEKLAGSNASYKDKDEASLKSRKTKTDYDLASLQANWNKELREKFGFNQDRLEAMKNLSVDKEKGDMFFNKSPSPEQQKKSSRPTSIFQNIAKLAKVKPKGLKKSQVKEFSKVSSGFTKEQVINSIASLQASLNGLQSQLSSMKSDDPTKLQLFGQFISLGFQLQQLQQQLAELERQEFQKKIDDRKLSDEKKEPEISSKSQGKERTRHQSFK